ncbi:MAG: outer membrane protein assembly factor BamB, partial [Gammaproteobacteria bacterium]
MKRCIPLVLIVVATFLGGCSTVTDWISPAETEPPAELQDIVSRVKAETLWSVDTGAGADDKRLRLAPYYLGGRLYVADADGKVAAVDAATGRVLWSVDLQVPISGGPGAGEGLVVVGTLDAEAIALSQADGSLKWRAAVSSEVLARPAIGGERVVIRTIDGKVQGLDATTGEERWRYEREIPVLTLR